MYQGAFSYGMCSSYSYSLKNGDFEKLKGVKKNKLHV